MISAHRRAETLQQHLELMVRDCVQLWPRLTAIILYGGFGRDEGSWFQDERGAWRPYNDYDICVITERKAPTHEVKALERSLAKEIGINWIDLDQMSPGRMKHLRVSIKTYDFKNAAKVVYGDPAVLELIPKVDASTLPMKEAQTLYFTRLYTLLASLNQDGIDQELEGEDSRFFRNQMAKAVLAVVDVLLLAKGAYHASYRKRVERAAALYPEKEELLELSRWALREKLRPQAPPMTRQEVREMYGTVHHHYLAEMYRGLSVRFRKAVRSPEDIELCMKWLAISLMKRVYWAIKWRSLKMEKRVSVMLAQSYIAAAWNVDGVDEGCLEQGIGLIRKADCTAPKHMSWDAARMQVARLRIEGAG